MNFINDIFLVQELRKKKNKKYVITDNDALIIIKVI